MLAYPVNVSATRPERFERIQLLVRLLILAVPSMLGISAWPFGVLYFGLPLVAAVLLTNGSGERFVANDAPRIGRVLVWVFQLLGYLTLVSDRFPTQAEASAIRVRIAPQGTPTLKSALLRLLSSLPSAIALMICGVVSCIVTTLGALLILFSGSYPKAWWGFQLAMLRWQARLFAYHASLVDTYPPFVLDTSPDEAAPPPSSVAIQH